MNRRLLLIAALTSVLFGFGCRDGSEKSGTAVENLPPVGVIAASDYQVVLYTGPDGPLYTVKGPDGRELASTINGARLRAEFPVIFERIKGTWAGD